jgi:hypothetical protein
VKAAEEPPNLKNPNQRRRKLSPYCLGFLLGSAFKLWVSGQMVVKESEIAFARIKIDFVVRNTRWGIASKYLHTNLSQFETQI